MNCKPGDLAYCTYGPNSGCIFEVLEEWGMWHGRFVWKVRTREVLQKWAGGDPLKPLPPSTDGALLDDWLRPISGVPIDDEVTEDLKEPA